MGDFLRTLIPWANWWNAVILSLDIIVVMVFLYHYNKTKSRNLLTSMPGLFTSLGILGTFGAICQSLAGISTDTAVSLPQVGMTVAEATTSAHNSLDLKEIIANLIPAFSTSIYGLVFAFFATMFTKLHFAKEDSVLVGTLKYKEPERALEALDEHVTKMTEAIDNEVAANKENNQKLTDSIAAQSDILDKFVEKFVKEMENCFKAMNTVIDHFGSKVKTKPVDEDHFLFDAEVSVSPTFFSWIFEFGGMIKIEGPEYVKQAYRQHAEKSLQ